MNAAWNRPIRRDRLPTIAAVRRGRWSILPLASLFCSQRAAVAARAGRHRARSRCRSPRAAPGGPTSRAGAAQITLHNTDSRPGEAQLITPSTGAVFADVEPIGPGTSTSVDVDLAAGAYAWRCLMEDEAAVTGPTVQLRGSSRHATPGVRPVPQADLVAPTQTYERYVSARLPIAADVAATVH